MQQTKHLCLTVPAADDYVDVEEHISKNLKKIDSDAAQHNNNEIIVKNVLKALTASPHIIDDTTGKVYKIGISSGKMYFEEAKDNLQKQVEKIITDKAADTGSMKAFTTYETGNRATTIANRFTKIQKVEQEEE